MRNEKETKEGGQKDVSSLERTTFKKKKNNFQPGAEYGFNKNGFFSQIYKLKQRNLSE